MISNLQMTMLVFLILILISCTNMNYDKKTRIKIIPPQIDSFYYNASGKFFLTGAKIKSYDDSINFDLTVKNTTMKESQLSFYGKCIYKRGLGIIDLDKVDSVRFYYGKGYKIPDEFIEKFEIDTNTLITKISKNYYKEIVEFISLDKNYSIQLRFSVKKGLWLYDKEGQLMLDLGYYILYNGKKGNVTFPVQKELFLEDRANKL